MNLTEFVKGALFSAICGAAVLVAPAMNAADKSADGPAKQPERKIFAHYMGCFPATRGAINFHWTQTYSYLRNPSGYLEQLGGNFVNWPLMPHSIGETGFSAEENARLEISRAMRFGFDGFAFDAWAGGGEAEETFETFFKVAEEMKADFELTICFDASCHWVAEGETMVDSYVRTAKKVLAHKDSPNMARFDGKPLFFGYYSNAIVPDQPGAPLADRLAREKEGWDKFRELVGEPVFIHGSMDAYNGDWVNLGAGAAKVYDAVGGFLGGGDKDRGGPEHAAAVRDGGAVWSQPMSFQYANKHGWVMAWGGLHLLRANWTAAINNDSRLIQFVTWNDYGEESCVAPTTGNGYSVIRVNQFFIDQWKNGGVMPPAEKDEIHVVFHRAFHDPDPFPLYSRRMTGGGELQVITMLTAPATIEVEGYGSYEAPAGLEFHDFPVKVGPVAVAAKRDGAIVASLKAHEQISDHRWREDDTLVAFGTNYDDEWKKDFPDDAPQYYSENGDIDGDGLPNWFEMYYFGQFPYHQTATVAEPDDDPDLDFFTNIEEYRNNTDPTKPDEPYPAGYVWDSSKLNMLPFTWIPMRDDHNHGVWYSYVERAGESGQVEFNGTWGPIPLMLANAKNRNLNDWNWATTIKYAANGDVELNNRPDSSMLLGWKAPLDGDFEVGADFSVGYGNDGILRPLLIMANAEGTNRIDETEIGAESKGFFATRKVKMAKGDMLLLTYDSKDAKGTNPLKIHGFTVKLLGKDGEAVPTLGGGDGLDGLPDLF